MSICQIQVNSPTTIAMNIGHRSVQGHSSGLDETPLNGRSQSRK